MYSQTIDLIIEISIDEDINKDVFKNSFKLSNANRKLFEISSEMRIISYSLKSRFPNLDLKNIDLLSEKTLQIILIEDFISTRLVDKNNQKLLPLDANIANDFITKKLNKPTKAYVDKLFEMDSLEEVHSGEYQYLNNVILLFNKAKEDIAQILYSID